MGQLIELQDLVCTIKRLRHKKNNCQCCIKLTSSVTNFIRKKRKKVSQKKTQD